MEEEEHQLSPVHGSLIFVFVFIYTFLSNAFVLMSLWNMFVYRQILPNPLTFFHALALTIIIEYIRNPHNKFFHNYFALDYGISAFWFNFILKPWIVLVLGIFCHELMY
jgi:hypothetical protein